MNYFIAKKFKANKKKSLIASRKHRKRILDKAYTGKMFKSGDILTINFWIKSYNYYFEGICLSLKNKNIYKSNSGIILRNVYHNIGIKVNALYFINRLYRNTSISDYKRKRYIYRSSKLYY